jgi:hypothetical protein
MEKAPSAQFAENEESTLFSLREAGLSSTLGMDEAC